MKNVLKVWWKLENPRFCQH